MRSRSMICRDRIRNLCFLGVFGNPECKRGFRFRESSLTLRITNCAAIVGALAKTLRSRSTVFAI